MNFYKHHIGDYAKKTPHLSIVEHGAYLLMLHFYYGTEAPLPKGRALYRLLRADSKIDRDAIDSVCRQFWTETPTGFINGRADEEIAAAVHQREVNRELGKLGGNPYLKEQYNEPGDLYVADIGNGRVKVGITGVGWAKRAYGLSKTYGSRPVALAVVRVENMGLSEKAVLDRFARFASGEVLTISGADREQLILFSLSLGTPNMPQVGAAIHQPNRVANVVANVVANTQATAEASISPIQTPDVREDSVEKDSTDANASKNAIPVDPPDPRKQLWDLGVSLLGESARSLIGKGIARVGESKVGSVLGDMAARPTADPKAYFVAATTPRQDDPARFRTA